MTKRSMFPTPAGPWAFGLYTTRSMRSSPALIISSVLVTPPIPAIPNGPLIEPSDSTRKAWVHMQDVSTLLTTISLLVELVIIKFRLTLPLVMDIVPKLYNCSDAIRALSVARVRLYSSEMGFCLDLPHQ